MRASRAKFLFVLLSVAIGVAALTGVRGFSQAFQKALLGDARGLMAGDLSARLFRLVTPNEMQQLDALKGVERTTVTETVSMASVEGDPVPLLVSLKAVNPAQYPFYGHVLLQPAGELRDALTDDTVLVDDNLLVRLNTKVGARLKIGGRWYRIAAVIVREPDRMSAGVGLGPRVMMTRHAMESSGLLGLGSRATERYLFKLDNPKQDIAATRTEIEKILPDALVNDFRETNPGLTEGLDHATGLLSLICLVAMVLGAIGVGMAMRAHLQQRIEVLAIMKSLGATSGDILRIYLLQTIFLGLAGGLIGVGLGLGVEYAFPSLLGSLMPLRPALGLAMRPVLAALATGVLTTVLFCLPPLLDVRHVRPIGVLRKMVEEKTTTERWSSANRPGAVQRGLVALSFLAAIALAGVGFLRRILLRHRLSIHRRPHLVTHSKLIGVQGLGPATGYQYQDRWVWVALAIVIAFGLAVMFYGWWGPKFRERRLQWISIAVIVAGLAGIATALSDSWLIGRWFAASLAGILIVILGLSAVALRGLRAFLAKTRLHMPSAIRHGLANLYRPGNQSAAVLAALGTGVMLILAVFLMQGAVVHEMRTEVAPGTPNVFLVDIAPDEIAGVRSLMAKQPGVVGGLETIPVISSRMTSIDGVSVEDLEVKNYPKRLLRSVALTWSTDVPQGMTVLQGKWWGKDDGAGLAVMAHTAERLHLHVGSQVVFEIGDKTLPTRVSVIYKVDGEHAFARSEFILAPKLIQDVPATWYGAIHFAPGEIAPMERALFAAYPTITVISLADILQTVQDVVGHIALVIRFLAGFSILAGAVILASSIASTRFRRIREVVVLKTLGATRVRIAQVFSIEFAVLGVLAGIVGAIFANLLAKVLLQRMQVTFHWSLWFTVLAVVCTALLAVVTGWVASFRILGQKPLEVLREE
jgi:predicted lysophospholipase L1 biosynthesis ABC-type transport system permease subunit